MLDRSVICFLPKTSKQVYKTISSQYTFYRGEKRDAEK